MMHEMTPKSLFFYIDFYHKAQTQSWRILSTCFPFGFSQNISKFKCKIINNVSICPNIIYPQCLFLIFKKYFINFFICILFHCFIIYILKKNEKSSLFFYIYISFIALEFIHVKKKNTKIYLILNLLTPKKCEKTSIIFKNKKQK